MTGADAAAWAQAYLSAAAIVASSVFAVMVPWNERRLNRKREERARLGVECRRSKSGGLEVVVTYVPEFQNYSVGISLQLIDPSDARVYKGKIVKLMGANGYSAIDHVVGALGENVRYNAVSLELADHNSVSRNAYRGVMFIEYPDERVGPARAKVKVSVLIHGNYLLDERTLQLTAVDDEYYARGGPIAVIKSSRPFG